MLHSCSMDLVTTVGMTGTIASPVLISQLRHHMHEVNFVYRQLPGALERAGASTQSERWSRFFLEQAAVLRTHHADLMAAATYWGLRLAPCISTEASELLNELRYALAARKEASTLERTVHGVLAHLRALVLKRLTEAQNIAVRLGEHDLAERLTALVGFEQQQETRMEEPWRQG